MKLAISLRTFIAAALATGILMCHPALASDLVIHDKQGEITLSPNPAKVLVFDLAALDTLTALGVDVSGVPACAKPQYLRRFDEAKYPKIGSLFEPDYEAVNAAKPDLVIVAGRSAPKYASLKSIAPTIDLSVDQGHYLDDARRNIKTLAEIFGKTAEAERLLSKLDGSIENLKALASTKGTGLAIMTTGGKISAFGPGSRYDMLFSSYGMKPAAVTEYNSNHGEAISYEYLLETNPDWLFVVDRDAALDRSGTAAAQLLDNEIVHQTKAWKEGHIVYLNPASWYLVSGGLTGMQQDVDELTSALGKE